MTHKVQKLGTAVIILCILAVLFASLSPSLAQNREPRPITEARRIISGNVARMQELRAAHEEYTMLGRSTLQQIENLREFGVEAKLVMEPQINVVFP